MPKEIGEKRKKRIMKIDFLELIFKVFIIELLILAGILLVFLIKLVINL